MKPQSEREKNNRLDLQKKFAVLVGRGMDPLEASQIVYGNLQKPKGGAENLLQQPVVQREMGKTMDLYGLSKATLVQKLSRVINLPGVNHDTLHKYLRTGFELHGELGNKPAEGVSTNNFLALFVRNRQERGLEIPKGMAEAVEMIQKLDAREEEVLLPKVPETEITITNNRGEKVELKSKEKPDGKRSRRKS